jgi:hypothetical protein
VNRITFSIIPVLLAGLLTVSISSLLDAQTYDAYNRDISLNQTYPDAINSQNPNNPKILAPGTIDFDTFVTYPTGSWPEVLAIGDLNNDNRNDVVLGTSFYFDSLFDYKIFVFIQNMGGGLNSPVVYDGGDIRAIDIGDLNNDNRTDVVIGHLDSIGIFFQNTSGTLDPMVSYYSGTMVDGVKIGNLNNDGLRDIAVCHWNEDYIRVFIQESSGIFDSSVTYAINSGGYDEIDVGDVTGDGRDDVVFMRGQLYANENIAIYEQTPSGSLLPPVFYDLGDTNTSGVAIGDVNYDSRNDIVVTHGGNGPSANISIWLQDPSGNMLDPPDSYACYDIPEPVEIADLDSDGRNDVIAANGGWLAISIYQQNGTGTMDPYINFPIPYASHYQPQGLAVGDINNDNKPDIALADYNNGLVVLINRSSGGVSIEEESNDDYRTRNIEFRLFQNYPNPFSKLTAISYQLKASSHTTLKIFDLTGKFVKTLVDAHQKAGTYQVPWDSRKPESTVRSGVYFYRLQSGEHSATRKLILIR